MSCINFLINPISRQREEATTLKKPYNLEDERVEKIGKRFLSPSSSKVSAKNRGRVKALTPAAAPPDFSNFPGLSKIVGSFFEMRSFLKAYQTRKYGNEGRLDAAMRFGAAPISWLNALASIITKIPDVAPFVQFLLPLSHRVLPATSILLKVANILGIIVCVVEGVAEVIYLKRVFVFSKKFHADSLKGLFEGINSKDPERCVEILQRWLKKFEEDPLLAEKFNLPLAAAEEKTYVAEKIEELRVSLNATLKAYRKGKRVDRRYRKEVAPKLISLEEKLLKRDLKRLNDEYLKIRSSEIELIKGIVKKNFSTLNKKERAAKVKEIVHEELQIKKIKFARRVGPWFVREVEDIVPGLLRGFRSKDPTKRDQAKTLTKELTKDIQIQAQKKMLVHIIGLIALTLTISALAFSMIGIPYIALPFLILGTVVAFLRYLLSTGFLCKRGWAFDMKKTLSKRLIHSFDEVLSPIKAYRLESQGATFEAFYKKHFTIDPKESVRLKELIIKQCPFWTKKERLAKVDGLVDSELYRKKKKLAKRVGIFLAQEMEEHIHSIAKSLTSRKAKKRQKAKAEAVELLEVVHIQTRKKMLVHSASLVALGLIGAAVAAFFLLNLYVVVALVLTALLFALIRIVLGKGLLNTKGWKFSFTDTFPEAVARRFAPPPGYGVS